MVDEWSDRSSGDSFNEAAARPEPAGGDGPANVPNDISADGEEPANVTSDIFSRDPNRPRLKDAFDKAARPEEENQDEDADGGTGEGGTGGGTGGDNSTGVDMEPGGPSRPKPPRP